MTFIPLHSAMNATFTVRKHGTVLIGLCLLTLLGLCLGTKSVGSGFALTVGVKKNEQASHKTTDDRDSPQHSRSTLGGF